MSVTTTTRLGITRWSAGTDPFTRAQMDASHAALEAKTAVYGQGTYAARPAPGVAGRHYFVVSGGANVNVGYLYYDNGAQWDLVHTYESSQDLLRLRHSEPIGQMSGTSGTITADLSTGTTFVCQPTGSFSLNATSVGVDFGSDNQGAMHWSVIVVGSIGSSRTISSLNAHWVAGTGVSQPTSIGPGRVARFDFVELYMPGDPDFDGLRTVTGGVST